jgi:hypothetical protein
MKHARRGIAPVVVLVGAGLMGCGSNDGGETSSSSGTASAKSGDTTTAMRTVSPTSPEAKTIVAPLRAMRRAWNTQDGEQYCAALTAGGRREILRLLPPSVDTKTFRTCRSFMTAFPRLYANENDVSLKQPPIAIKLVKASTRRARATVSGGLVRNLVTTYTVVKRHGRWKVPTPINDSLFAK